MNGRARTSIGFLLACAVAACAGCATAPLGGTKWDVVELVYSGEEPEYEDIDVEFTRDGRVITTATKPDGSTTVEDRERYSVDRGNQIITLMHPDYKLMCMYRFEGEQLRVHSERFIVRMNPIKE